MLAYMYPERVKVRARAVIIHDGQLLLVRHSHQKAPVYVLPGGHLDHGETPAECMKRELLEELGIPPVLGRLLYVYSFIGSKDTQSIEFFFEIKNTEAYRGHATVEKTHAHEIGDARWVGRDEEIEMLPPEFLEEFRNEKVFEEGVRFLKGA